MELNPLITKNRTVAATAVIFAELNRTLKDGWEFKAIGEGKIGDLNTLLSLYM